MKHKTWFRLVIKAIGVLILGFAVPEIAQPIAYFLLIDAPTSNSWSPSQWTMTLIGPALKVAIGSYLLLDGRWVVDKCIPSNHPYCPECGYDLSKSTSAHCPECGVASPTRDGIAGE